MSEQVCKHCEQDIFKGPDGGWWTKHGDKCQERASQFGPLPHQPAEPSPEPEAAPEPQPAENLGLSRCESVDIMEPLTKLRESLSASIKRLNAEIPTDRPMHQVAASLCGDFIYMARIEHHAHNLNAELAQLRARVAILDAQEVALSELTPIKNDWADTGNFFRMEDYRSATRCRERQLLDATRAVQAWREVAANYPNQHGEQDGCKIWGSSAGDQRCDVCKSYDALAEKGE